MNGIFLPLLLFFYNNLAFHNLGITIIEIAILSRIVFYPFAKQQAKYTQAMKNLQPQMNALKAKHKGNQQALSQAQMDLFKQHGVNPAAGCLPSIVQIVVLLGLMGALNEVLTMNIETRFLIWDMAKPDAVQIAGIPLPLPGILVILAAVSQYIQIKMMMPTPPAIRKEDKKQEKEEKADFMTQFAETQTSMMWMFPLLFLFLGVRWPSGLALYWSVTSVLTIVQQYRIKNKHLPTPTS